MADYGLGPFRVRPCGNYNPATSYRFLDLVAYNGGSYLLINQDTLDDNADVIGVLPVGQDDSELYWQCIVERGEKGETADQYYGFIEVTDGQWDFSETDKITIPEGGVTTLNINNIYNGCCGVVLSTEELTLPDNSEYSIDFFYVTRSANQYYLYTFVYGSITGDDKFIWNRTVITQ
jgi:hypothetical protein